MPSKERAVVLDTRTVRIEHFYRPAEIHGGEAKVVSLVAANDKKKFLRKQRLFAQVQIVIPGDWSAVRHYDPDLIENLAMDSEAAKQRQCQILEGQIGYWKEIPQEGTFKEPSLY